MGNGKPVLPVGAPVIAFVHSPVRSSSDSSPQKSTAVRFRPSVCAVFMAVGGMVEDGYMGKIPPESWNLYLIFIV